MDDLMSLDWSANSSSSSNNNKSHQQSSSQLPGSRLGASSERKGSTISDVYTSQQMGPTSSQANSTYNFDSLTRSLNNSSPSYLSNSNQRAALVSSSNNRAIPSGSTPAPASSSSVSSDAFSSLLSFTGAAQTQNSNSNMSMAERQSRTEAERRETAERESKMNEARWGSAAGWESMSSKPTTIRSPTSPTSRPPVSAASSVAASRKNHDIWVFGPLPSSGSNNKKSDPNVSRPQQPSQSRFHAQDRSQRKPQPKLTTKSQDPFDFDSFEDPGDSQGSALGGQGFEDEIDFLGGHSTSRSQTSKNYSGQPSVGEDDILGALAGPAQPQPTNSKTHSGESATSSRMPSPTDGSRAHLQSRRAESNGNAFGKGRSKSPPPHIVGQLVEMGFSPVEARKALSQTPTGLDVQAAAEFLVGSAAGSSSRRNPRNDSEEDEDGRSEGSEEERDRQLAWELQREEENRGKQRRRFGDHTGDTIPAGPDQAPRRPSQRTSRRADPEKRVDVEQDGTPIPDWQKQADQLYNQAQEIGSSVFNKANAFWSSAKAQAQKALEERAAASQASGGESGRSSPATAGSEKSRVRRWGTSSNSRADRTKEWEGKPRWMVEAEEAEVRDVAASKQGSSLKSVTNPISGVFKDSDEEQDEVQPSKDTAATRPPVEGRPPRQSSTERTRPQHSQDLWDLPPDSVNSSSAPASSSSTTNSIKPASRNPQPPSRSAHPPVPKFTRNLIPEDHSDSAPFIAEVAQLKFSGNELFKRGSYGEAEQVYSQALEILPEKSLRRVPLLNNRSNARLKNGDSRNAIRDASEVLSIILPNSDVNSKSLIYNPNSDLDLPRHLLVEVNLRDSWSKTLLRKAQAEEILEKWVSARTTWLNLERFEKEFGSGRAGVQNMRSSRDGISRCEKMMSGRGHTRARDANLAGNTDSNVRAKSLTATKASKSAAEAVKRAEAAGRERVRAENAAADAEDAAKFALKDKVDAQINDWKKGKENNVRALIASVDSMTWTELDWKKIGMHELITDVQVKKGYTRAIAKLHPDKLTPKNSNLEQRMIAAGVFSVLNDAWIASQN